VEVHDEIIKNRVIMNFHQDAAKTEQVLSSLEVMIEHGNFAADTIIVDGYDFTQSSPDDLKKFKNFAARTGLEVWFSASLKGDDPLLDKQGIPFLLQDYIKEISVLITLAFDEGNVRLHLIKDHDYPSPLELHLRLDPKTLLIAK
jgi:hypothetical protein